MSRMLDALKALESRQRAEQPQQDPPAAAAAPAADWESEIDRAEAALAKFFEPAPPEEPAAKVTAELAKPVAKEAAFEVCTLPIAAEVADYYAEMSETIENQLASNYCNVLLFVGADRHVEPSFSMVHLAQAFARRAAGDVLLVDGDLRFGRLSKAVAGPGPGMIEAMLGKAQWPDIIHPTQAARIDFVASGHAQVPTVERPEFGWGALRPRYRYVLIGVSNQAEPETTWLGGRSDAVYLVLSRQQTRRSSASTAINTLRGCGANVMGSIVVDD